MQGDVINFVREELGDALNTLNVDVEDKDIEEAYALDVQHWADTDDKFKANKEDDEDEAFKSDFQLARELLLKSLDKSEKILDETFNQIAVKTTPMMLELGQEATKNIQNGVKGLIDLHNSFQTIKQKELRNKKEIESPDDKPEDTHTDKNGNKVGFDD